MGILETIFILFLMIAISCPVYYASFKEAFRGLQTDYHSEMNGWITGDIIELRNGLRYTFSERSTIVDFYTVEGSNIQFERVNCNLSLIVRRKSDSDENCYLI